MPKSNKSSNSNTKPSPHPSSSSNQPMADIFQPSSSGSNKKYIYIAAIIVVIVISVSLFFVYRNLKPSSQSPSPTPTPTLINLSPPPTRAPTAFPTLIPVPHTYNNPQLGITFQQPGNTSVCQSQNSLLINHQGPSACEKFLQTTPDPDFYKTHPQATTSTSNGNTIYTLGQTAVVSSGGSDIIIQTNSPQNNSEINQIVDTVIIASPTPTPSPSPDPPTVTPDPNDPSPSDSTPTPTPTPSGPTPTHDPAQDLLIEYW